MFSIFFTLLPSNSSFIALFMWIIRMKKILWNLWIPFHFHSNSTRAPWHEGRRSLELNYKICVWSLTSLCFTKIDHHELVLQTQILISSLLRIRHDTNTERPRQRVYAHSPRIKAPSASRCHRNDTINSRMWQHMLLYKQLIKTKLKNKYKNNTNIRPQIHHGHVRAAGTTTSNRSWTDLI